MNRMEMMKSRTWIIICLMALFCLYSADNGFAGNIGNVQVDLSPDRVVLMPGETTDLVMVYNVVNGEEKTTGLGLRIHYNSRAIAEAALFDVYSGGLLARDLAPQDDVDDLDKDPQTDKYLGVAWIGISGDWPGSLALPAELGKVRIQAVSNDRGMTTGVNITSSSSPAGYGFTGVGAVITIP